MTIALNTKKLGSFHFGLCKDGSQNNLSIFPYASDSRSCCACGNTLPDFKPDGWWESTGLYYEYEGAHLMWMCCDQKCIDRVHDYLFNVMGGKEKDDYIDLMIECYRIAEKEYLYPMLNKYSVRLPKGLDA